MPIALDKEEITVVDHVQITKFEVEANGLKVIIHFSKGTLDSNSNFVAKEYGKRVIQNPEIDLTLYSQVKDALYSMLSNQFLLETNPIITKEVETNQPEEK
jgi:hypothetical protein